MGGADEAGPEKKAKGDSTRLWWSLRLPPPPAAATKSILSLQPSPLLQQPVSLRQPKALLLAATLSKVSRAHHNYKTAFLEAHGSSQPGGKSCAIYKLCTKTSTWMFGQQNVQALPLRSVFYSSCQKCLIFCLAHTYSQGWRELFCIYSCTIVNLVDTFPL